MKISLKRIYTKDGIELVGLLYEPEQGTKQVLVHVHGMGGNFYENSFLDAIAQTLTTKGVAFFAFNNRGCESFKDLTQVVNGKKKTVRIGNAYEKFEDSALDIAAAIDAVATWGFSTIHLAGHSLGCSKVIYYVTETKDARIASVLLLSPSDMLGLARKYPEDFQRDSHEATEMVKNGKGNEIMSHQVWGEYPMSAVTYMSLFGEDSKIAVLNFYKPTDQLEVVGKITQPLFAIMGRKDDALVVPIEETFERLTKAVKNSSHVETKILGDANHGYTGDEQALVEEIVKWAQR